MLQPLGAPGGRQGSDRIFNLLRGAHPPNLAVYFRRGNRAVREQSKKARRSVDYGCGFRRSQTAATEEVFGEAANTTREARALPSRGLTSLNATGEIDTDEID